MTVTEMDFEKIAAMTVTRRAAERSNATSITKLTTSTP